MVQNEKEAGYRAPASDLAGLRTHVTENNRKNLPAETNKDPTYNYSERPSGPGQNRQQALPIKPEITKNREKHQPTPDEPSRPPAYNAPPSSGTGQTPDDKSLSKDRARTKGVPGEEYGHPHLQQDYTIKQRRPDITASTDETEHVAAMGGPPFPIMRQRHQTGKAKLYYKRYYRKNRSQIRRKVKKWHVFYSGTTPRKRDKDRRQWMPERFKRHRGGGIRSVAERSKKWREENKTPRTAAENGIWFFCRHARAWGHLLEIDGEGAITYLFENEILPQFEYLEDFIEHMVFVDDSDLNAFLAYVDEAFEYTEEEDEESVRIASVVRQHKQKGRARQLTHRYYTQHRAEYKKRAKARYRKMRNNPGFKRKQHLRHRNPNRFRRITASVLTAPDIAFVFGPEQATGIVHSVSPFTGEITFSRTFKGRTYFESLPVPVFLASVAFMSDEDIDAMFDLIDLELGPEGYSAPTPEAVKASANFDGIDCNSSEFREMCQTFFGSPDLKDLSETELSLVDQKIVAPLLGRVEIDREEVKSEINDGYIWGQVSEAAIRVAAMFETFHRDQESPENLDTAWNRDTSKGTPAGQGTDRAQGTTTWIEPMTGKPYDQNEKDHQTPAHAWEAPAVVNNPGSAKVIPEGHDFVNKKASQGRAMAWWKAQPREHRELLVEMLQTRLWKNYTHGLTNPRDLVEWLQDRGWVDMTKDKFLSLLEAIHTLHIEPWKDRELPDIYERVKVAKLMQEIEQASSPELRKKAKGLQVTLRKVSPRKALWTFLVKGSEDTYKVRVHAPKKEGVTKVQQMDVFVSCSCPFWRYQGPEYWAKKGDYLYGRPRGTATAPDVRDPAGKHAACKHVLAVFKKVRAQGSVEPRWGEPSKTWTWIKNLWDRFRGMF